MTQRQRGRAFIDRNKSGILSTPANSYSGTSRPDVKQEPPPFLFLPSLRSHYTDYTDMSERVKAHVKRTLVGWADTQGRRKTMEDQLVIYGHEKFDLVAVFDGHNGSDTSLWAGDRIGRYYSTLFDSGLEPDEALKKALFLTNEYVRTHNITGGTTALVSVILEDDIIVGNIGDCRMIMWKDGAVHRVTHDHKPNDEVERARIEGIGGEVTETTESNGTVSYRVNAVLAVARALGDFSLEPFISSVPDIFHVNISVGDYLVIACDGLWDVLKDQEVVQICNAYWRDNKDPSDLEGVASRLRNTAYSRNSTDNISVVVIKRFVS